MKKIILLIFIILGCAAPEKEVPEKEVVEEIEEKPKLSEAKKHYSFGREYFKNKMYDEAIKNLQKAIEDSVGFIDAYILLAEVYTEKKDYGEAEKVYQKLTEVEPVKGHYAIGTLYSDKKRYDDALVQYKKVIEIDSNYVDAWFGIGYVYEKKGEIKKAIENYEEALKINPENEAVIFAISRVYIEDKQFDKGISGLEKLEQKRPEDLEIKAMLGNAYLETKNYIQAKEKFEYITTRRPQDIINKIKLGSAYEGLKDYDNAIKTYKEAISIDTTNISSYRYLIDLYIKIKNLAEAESLIKRALKLSPEDQILQCLLGDVNFEYGVLFFKQKKYDEAIAKYQAAITQYNKALEGEKEVWQEYAKKAIERTKIKLKEAKDEKWWH